MEGADIGGDPTRRHRLCLGLSAVRSRDRRGRRRADRAPDRTGARADEALPGNGRIVLRNVSNATSTAHRSRSSRRSTRSTPGISRKTRRRGYSSTFRPGPAISTSRSTASPRSPTAKLERRHAMFSVIFEVHPKPEQWDAYLGNAKMLRPELEQVDGFVDNIRYKSLTRARAGSCRCPAGATRRRWCAGEPRRAITRCRRRAAPKSCSTTICASARSRRTPGMPRARRSQEQRLDETEIGEGTTITLIDAKRPAQAASEASRGRLPPAIWAWIRTPTGLVGWDVFDAVLTPGDLILLMSWKHNGDADGLREVSAKCRRARGCGMSASCATTACSTAARRRNITRRLPVKRRTVSNRSCRLRRAMMPYFLYSAFERRRVSELFATEKEMWVHVRAQIVHGSHRPGGRRSAADITSRLRNSFMRR